MRERRKEFKKQMGRDLHPLACGVVKLSLREQASRLRAFYTNGMKSLNEPLSLLEQDQMQKRITESILIAATPNPNDPTEPNENMSSEPRKNKNSAPESKRNASSIARTIKATYGKVWKQKLSRKNGNTRGPSVVIITLSANRATDILKQVKAKLKLQGLKLAKLFARHIKQHEQEKFLKGGCGGAVGTPLRIQRLCESGALDFKEAEVVFVDLFRDKKNMNLFTIKDTEKAMVKLFHSCIYPALAENTKICFF
ncbi:hypothetical protein AAMO2058_000819400 [Amorphochlora amoebiformis]|mmetsp:Transcript_10425/g.16466  ORF Transcript_10425/g.16466 Transcript_10425/m.16466 type:complete len:254 (-) Transcript_10425:33-794(-)